MANQMGFEHVFDKVGFKHMDALRKQTLADSAQVDEAVDMTWRTMKACVVYKILSI